jgi:hypothetical protein
MATFKTTSGDYTVNLGPYDSGNSKWAGTMNVNGNLNVVGNITYVSDIAVNDAFIVVAANNTGTVTDMGLIAKKTSNTYAGLRFDVSSNTWQVSSSVTVNGVPVAAYANIATGNASVSGTNTQVQFNDSGNFGASGNLTFDKTLNQLSVFTGSQVLGNIGTAPTAVSNAVAIYNLEPGVGGTGVYARTTTTQDELISLTKARLFAIIF